MTGSTVRPPNEGANAPTFKEKMQPFLEAVGMTFNSPYNPISIGRAIKPFFPKLNEDVVDAISDFSLNSYDLVKDIDIIDENQTPGTTYPPTPTSTPTSPTGTAVPSPTGITPIPPSPTGTSTSIPPSSTPSLTPSHLPTSSPPRTPTIPYITPTYRIPSQTPTYQPTPMSIRRALHI